MVRYWKIMILFLVIVDCWLYLALAIHTHHHTNSHNILAIEGFLPCFVSSSSTLNIDINLDLSSHYHFILFVFSSSFCCYLKQSPHQNWLNIINFLIEFVSHSQLTGENNPSSSLFFKFHQNKYFFLISVWHIHRHCWTKFSLYFFRE